MKELVPLSFYEIDDPNFENDLLKSDLHVSKVAIWLRSRGAKVIQAKLKIRPKIELMSEYSDSGSDLIVEFNGIIGGIGVKQRHLKFTSKSDFPYNTVIVDVEHVWRKADPKPLGYVLTNEDVTAGIFVDAKTENKWRKVDKWDRFKKRDRTFLECPIIYVTFFKM